MSKRKPFFTIFALIFLAGLYWLMAEALGGWTILAKIMAVMAVGFVVVGACMLAIIGIIYYLTIFRSNRYARRLREAGYAVKLEKHEVWGFALMTLMALVFIPMAAWMTEGAYGVHLCIQTGKCSTPEGWYHTTLFMIGMIWLIGLLSLGSTIKMWWQSFRPLRKYYNEMQLGHQLDLPRLR